MKKLLSLCLVFSLLCSLVTPAFAVDNTPLPTEKNYKVYNGYGEIIYEADTLEEAEVYLNSLSGSRSVSRSAILAARTAIKIVTTIVLVDCTIYTVQGVLLGKADLIDIIDLFFPIETLMEIEKNREYISVYTSSGTIVNPYPPNSYQGTRWIKDNFYCVVGN